MLICARGAWVAVTLMLGASPAWAATDTARCAELLNLRLPHTTITSAQAVAAGAFRPPGPSGPPGVPSATYAALPAFCRVAGTLRPTPDSDIRFEAWMPEAGWNGKFVGVGNGVWAGAVSYAEMVAPLLGGYATASTDDGHQGSPFDASFAAGHPEKLIDFGYRAPHEMTLAAKAVIVAFYGTQPSRALFASCSTGGRQGLEEAYRYPTDYDGISAGAPANGMVPLMVSSLWTGYSALKDPQSRIPPEKLILIHKAALQACDAADGVQDGIISAPEQCHFEPAVLLCKGGDAADCLTAPQVAAIKAIYQGPVDPRTRRPIFAGPEPGSETMLPFLTMGPEPFAAATSFMKSLVFHDPQWDFRSFDYDRDVVRALDAAGAQLDVPAAGLGRYLGAGRKLLLYHGWADGLIPPRNTIEFYEALVSHVGPGEAQKTARLFMVPGMGHCGGGEGPYVMDVIAAIDGWVASDIAPERIIVRNPPGASARSRPLCAYPQRAVYAGTGSPDSQEQFHCAIVKDAP